MTTILSSIDASHDATPARAPTLAVLLRHQTASLAATLVDFGTMIAVVEALRISPSIATFIGASLGAITNFTLSRVWAFRVRGTPLFGQAFRYALVSFASVLINSFGEWLAHDRAHLNYVVARLGIAAAVSLLWNFPMHRHFVFRVARAR